MQNQGLVKVGAICALIVAVMQVVGNGLHPPLPLDPAGALMTIANTGRWIIVHLIITASYFVLMLFAIGVAESFKQEDSALIRVAVPLVIAGAALGAAQIMIHLTIYKVLADQYVTSSDVAVKEDLVLLYRLFSPYSAAMELAHRLVIFPAGILFGIAMLNGHTYPRWTGWLGIVSGVVAVIGLLAGKVVLAGPTGDIVFGVSLIPLVVWIIAIGIFLLRPRPLTQLQRA